MLRIGAFTIAPPLTVGPITVYPRAASASISACSPAASSALGGIDCGIDCGIDSASADPVPSKSSVMTTSCPGGSSLGSVEF